MPEGLSGDLAQLPLRRLLTMLAAGGQSGLLRLNSDEARGEIHLDEGAPVHAISERGVGLGAVASMLSWTSGSFGFDPTVETLERSIALPLDEALAEADRMQAEWRAIERVIPSLGVVPRLAHTLPDGPITFEPQEWLALSYADGDVSLRDIVDVTGHDPQRVAGVFARLASQGLVEIDVPDSCHAAPVVPQAVLSDAFFSTLTAAVSAAIGPLAEIVVEEAVADLGERWGQFPQARASALVERVAIEISDDERRARFQRGMLRLLGVA